MLLNVWIKINIRLCILSLLGGFYPLPSLANAQINWTWDGDILRYELIRLMGTGGNFDCGSQGKNCCLEMVTGDYPMKFRSLWKDCDIPYTVPGVQSGNELIANYNYYKLPKCGIITGPQERDCTVIYLKGRGPLMSSAGHTCQGTMTPPPPPTGPGPGPSPVPLNCNMNIIGSGFNFGTIPANGLEGKSTTSMVNIQCSGRDSDSGTGRLTLNGLDGTDKAKIKNSQGDVINIQLIADTNSGSNIKSFYAQNGFNVTYTLVARILTSSVANYGEFSGQAIAKLDIY